MEDALHAEMGGIDMSEWIKYDGSDKQIEEINNARYGILAKNNFNYIWPDTYEYFDFAPIGATEYLICQPHPYADLIKIWADTGCPVYWRSKHGGAAGACHENFPPFAHPNEFEYLLTPFED